MRVEDLNMTEVKSNTEHDEMSMTEEEIIAIEEQFSNMAKEKSNKTKEHKTPSKCGKRLACSAIFIGVGYVLWHFVGSPDIRNLDLGDVLGNLTDFDFMDGWRNEPFLGDNTTHEWDNGNGKNGLSLTIWNALEENWQKEYEVALHDWENGDPDALTLTSRRVNIDEQACEQTRGVMRVCSGNFGDTKWLGLNEVLKVGNYIVSSVAKMNEYYLANANIYERQYTMCHEFGHGFGLPHTDENFYNRDLGNCMDYTDNPRNNLHPDRSNYARLAEVYGIVGQGQRHLKGSLKAEGYPVLSPELSDIYHAAMVDLNDALSEAGNLGESGWRALRLHPKGATYSRDLVSGMSLEVNMLFTQDTE
mmetsp:Transcript_9924/g.14033  ORF Transcript_9924/g.14033 Transcript_9924/m.14033 type:complete len:361 (-) Transcript_9924:2472-3554(-)